MPVGRRARIFLVDDHPVVRGGLRQLIGDEQDLETCGEAADFSAGLTGVRETAPDLVVVDISLGGANGLELIKHLKARDPDLSILVASVHDESVYAERALRAGAMGYISKQAPSDELLRAMRVVLSGRIYLSSEASQGALRRMLNGGEVEEDAVSLLSDRELEVFELVGRGIPTKEIAERLHLSVKTIETHRARIKVKLGLKGGTELVLRAVTWVLEHQT